MRTLNAHGLLAGTTASSGYLDALDVGVPEERALRAARDIVREQLRSGLRDLQDRGIAHLVEQRYVAKAASLPPMRPRFRMQGSMKYRTLNNPAQTPPQEIDVDDGVYLPTSFVTANGAARPVLASRLYFQAVEKILEPLCNEKGWVLDRSKQSCVRVRLTTEAHLDLPLYAIPDDQFIQLAVDSAILNKSHTQDLEFSEAAYKGLPTDQIMLARRNAEWRRSDPRQIEDWFLDAIAEHGEVVRHVSRYLKGWRDFQMEKSKISSLLLMSCAVATFDALGGAIAADRDDLALLEVAKRLPTQFAGAMTNPIFSDQILNDDWTPAERATFINLANTLHREIEAALNATYNKDIAIHHFQTAFGDRVPYAPDLIAIDDKEAAVLAYPRAKVTAPAVPRTTSG
jgi:hypothetical protein